MTLNPQQFSFKYQQNNGLHSVDALHPETSYNMGFIEWNANSGAIENIKVNDDMKRQGIGTALWEQAHKAASERNITPPRHAEQRTPEGDAWARAVGGELPGRRAAHYERGSVGMTNIDPLKGEDV